MQVILPIFRRYQLTRRSHGHVGQIGRIGPHVSDVTVFVEPLSNAHRVPGGKAQFAVGLLLQRAGRKRGVRLLRERFFFQRADIKLPATDPLKQPLRLLLVQQRTIRSQFPRLGIEVLAGGNPLAVHCGQRRFKRFPMLSHKRAQQVPVGRPHKRHPFALALHNQPHRHTLHSSGGQLGTNLPPQQRRDAVAVEAV